MTAPIAAAPPSAPPDAPAPAPTRMWSGENGFGFADFLDLINPLQHIPVISTIYRAITGDDAALGPRLIGGMLLGGPIGLMATGIIAAVEESTGKSTAGHAVAMVKDLFAPGAATEVADAGGSGPPEPPDEATPRDDMRPPSELAASASPAQIGLAQELARVEPAAGTRPMPPSLATPHAGPASIPAWGPRLPTAATADDAESQRIARSVDAARRAQAAVLFAMPPLAPPNPAPDQTDENPAAPPGWVADAMSRALDKYQRAGAAAAPASPAVSLLR